MYLLNNTKWKNYQSVLVPVVSPHININISKEEQKKLLKESKVYFLRWTNQFDTQKSEFWYIIKDSKEDLNSYKSKQRNQIKKALKSCIVKKVSNEVIANSGYDIYLKAFKKYNTYLKPIEKESFYNQTINSNYDYFAVYEKEENRMIAYSENSIENRVCNYSTIKFDPEYLKLYPSYALFYEMNRYYLNEKKFLYVHDGARSISHDTQIHNFLIQKFNFRKAYCKLNLFYSLKIKIAIFLLYPFKFLINKSKNKKLQKISVLLKHEEIRRSYD